MDVATAIERRVESGEVHGAAWLVDRAGDVSSGAAGISAVDSIFRISSVTKPVVAVLAMQLVDDGLLSLDDPVDGLLPELADRRVLRAPDGPLDDTVPADRPITVRDVLEFRLGLGMDFAGPFPGTVLGALADRGLPVGPPAPQASPGPDEWMRIVGSVPLSHQPGTRWLYNTGAQVLGVLVARAAGQPLPDLLAQRLLDPLGMADTGFHVPPDRRDRLAGSGSARTSTTSPTGSGRRRPRSPTLPPAWCRRSRTCTRSPGACERATRRGARHATGRTGDSASACSAPTSPTGGTPGPTAGTVAWARRGGRTR